MAKKQKKRAAGEADGLTKKDKINVINTVGTVFMFVILALVLYATMFRGAQRPSARLTEQQDRNQEAAAKPAATPAATPVQRAACPTRGGEAWEYDAATDCYFDPSVGHAHWHQGAAPPMSERAARMAGPAPTPIPIGAPTPLPVQPPQP